LQEFCATRTNGVNSAVPAIILGERRWRTRLHQRHFEASILEAKREACSNQSSANNSDIEFHKGIIHMCVFIIFRMGSALYRLEIIRRTENYLGKFYEEWLESTCSICKINDLVRVSFC
jgi:hypothetical protein